MIKQFYLTYRPIDLILTGTITPGHSGPGINGNEEVFHIRQGSGTGAILSDTVWCHTQDTYIYEDFCSFTK